MITLSIELALDFNERSGMATSTRRMAVRLWGHRFPVADLRQLAYMLFCCDNLPGTTEISGAQDIIGPVFSDLVRSDYHGDCCPHHIEHLADESASRFVEQLLGRLSGT